jgi:hypothetical protein
MACTGTIFPYYIIVVTLHSALAVIWWPLTLKAHIQSQASVQGPCGGQRGAGTHFAQSTLVSSVKIIPPMLHTDSFNYQHCHIILAIDNVIQ